MHQSRNILLLLTAIIGYPLQFLGADDSAKTPVYEYRPDHDPNGIGKFYLGREIARVMGHEGADWLERPGRQEEERPDLLIKELNLKPGEVVADIGAGSGYYSWRAAQQVGPTGLVYAVDIQQEMLDLLARRMAERKVSNVRGVLGTAMDPGLPAASVDVVLLVDVYHEFEHPHEMMKSICASLKSGGRVVLVEFRAEDPRVPIKEVHKMSEKQVRKEMAEHPLTWVSTSNVLPWQHVIQFQKSSPPAKGAALHLTPPEGKPPLGNGEVRKVGGAESYSRP